MQWMRRLRAGRSLHCLDPSMRIRSTLTMPVTTPIAMMTAYYANPFPLVFEIRTQTLDPEMLWYLAVLILQRSPSNTLPTTCEFSSSSVNHLLAASTSYLYLHRSTNSTLRLTSWKVYRFSSWTRFNVLRVRKGVVCGGIATRPRNHVWYDMFVRATVVPVVLTASNATYSLIKRSKAVWSIGHSWSSITSR